MSDGLALPFAGTLDSDKQVFSITQPAQGGTAIWGFSGGLKADHSPGIGVAGTSYAGGTGVSGTSDSGLGVHGQSNNGAGVYGTSTNGSGIVGVSQTQDAINGNSSSQQHAGVSANNNGGGFGLWAKARIAGHFEYFAPDGKPGIAIEAFNTSDADVIMATSSSPNHAAVSGHNNSGGYGLWASSTNTGGQGGIGIYATGAKYAAQFDGQVMVAGELTAISGSAPYAISALGLSRFNGSVQVTNDINVGGNVNVTGDVRLLGADCAEEFEIAGIAQVDPGTVMVLAENGALEVSQNAYDKRVAGVISGAGDYRPGLILDRQDSCQERLPLALIGKVYCKVDAQYARIEAGDLLTTSPTPGHAMRATDPLRAFGTVIGKALGTLQSGQGLIPILVALQ